MSKFMDLFPLPDALLPWKHADDAAGYTVRVFIFGMMFFVALKYIFMKHLCCLSRHCFGVTALHFPEIICQSKKHLLPWIFFFLGDSLSVHPL